MRLLSFLLSLIALSVSIPPLRGSITERRNRLEKIFGKPVNMYIADGIVAEEAKVLDIPAREHFNSCFPAVDDDVKETQLVEEGIKELLAQVGNFRFTSIDTVMDDLKTQAPKVHALFAKMEQAAGELDDEDNEAATFLVTLKEDLISMLYNHVTMSAEERPEMYGKALKKIFADYEALSKQTKDDIEKNGCPRTIFRISAATGADKEEINFLKNYIEALMNNE